MNIDDTFVVDVRLNRLDDVRMYVLFIVITQLRQKSVDGSHHHSAGFPTSVLWDLPFRREQDEHGLGDIGHGFRRGPERFQFGQIVLIT